MNAPRKASLAVLAGVAITGVVGAAAASLGGLTTDSLGADDAIVAACDDDGIDVVFTTSHDGTSFVVDSVDFSDVAAACDGLSWDLVLIDEDDAEIFSDGGTVNLSSGGFSVSPTNVTAEALGGISLVISGPIAP
jgi:hypothetical protein